MKNFLTFLTNLVRRCTKKRVMRRVMRRVITLDNGPITDRQRTDNGPITPRSLFAKIAAVVGLLVTIGVGNAWGEDITISYSDFTKDGDIISATKQGVTVSCYGNTPNAQYVTFTEGNTLTISSTAGNITAIDFTCSAADYTGNMTDVSGISTTSWSITVDNPGNKTTVRVSSIVVTVTGKIIYLSGLYQSDIVVVAKHSDADSG